ncbi:galactokinase [Cellulophaga sp. HaHaR_3_176]|uniref:galactokinase n=1 Tax=Cellulophaga sp. HaHaR_3_176 TaxID=1942464 RepID=UPI001C1F4172|nr:galactokinase [Cellulophaga sp. HaHaR_3_176]QWX82797.1 galactokinase [Cellulophaga sp. HaHaR_3_176]
MNKAFIKTIKKGFTTQFNAIPTLIFSPGRINIIGEHTDYNDGFVFPAAVNKGIITAIHKSESNSSFAYAIDKNELLEFSLNDIKPLPKGTWQNYVIGVVAEMQKKGITIGNFNIAFGGNIPAGAGMSSSAALENSVVFGLNEIFKLSLSKEDMIFISQNAEHNYAGVKCGIMDQYASMFGIKNNALLLDCRTIQAKPFEIDFKDYELILINTNVKHNLSDSAYNNRRSICEKIVKLLKVKALRDVSEDDLKLIAHKISVEDFEKAHYIIQENNRVLLASDAILKGDLKTLGKLLYASHNGLQNKFKVSCDELDFLVEQAKLNPHILGARMMGGGFGGCTINLISKSATAAFKTHISKVYKNKFNINCSIYTVSLSNGTHVIK